MPGSLPVPELVGEGARVWPARIRLPGTRLAVAVVGGLVVAGVVLRVAVACSSLGPVDADEAVVGLMARAALRGRFVAFYRGQEYGGAHEYLLVAAMLAVRVPQRLAMELVPAGLSAAGAVVLWRIGRRVTSELAALVGAGLFWATSAAFVWHSTKERGFYGATLVLGLLAVLLVLRLVDAPSRRDGVLLGLVAGSAWYASPQSVYLLVPAGLWYLLDLVRRRDRTRIAAAALAVAAAPAGALPWLWHNAATRLGSLHTPPFLPSSTYGERLELFFRSGVAKAVPARTPVSQAWTLGAGFGLALLVATAVAVGLGFLRVRRGRRLLVATLLVAYPLVFAALPTSFYLGEPRYLYLLWPTICLAVACGATVGRAVGPAVAGVALLVPTVAGLAQMAGLERQPDEALHDLAPVPIERTVGRLEALGADRVWADYWLAARLTWESHGRVRAGGLQFIRFPETEAEVREAARPPYVLMRGGCYDRMLLERLDELGDRYERWTVGEIAVTRPRGVLQPEDLVLDWASARGIPAGHDC